MKGGITISAVGHGAVLLWALVSFARPLDNKPTESMPIDIVSVDEFTKMTAGTKNAPKKDVPKPLVEKVAPPKPVEDPAAKVTEKKEVQAAVETPPVPEPQPKPPEPKPAAAPPQPKPEAKAPDKKEPEQKVDPIADALKKDDAKKPEKKAETKPLPLPPKPVPQPPKFDPRQVAALLNKDKPQRVAAAGEEINTNPNPGYAGGQAAKLTQGEIDAFRRKVHDCWNTLGLPDDAGMKVVLRVLLKRDGALAAPPTLVAGTNAPGGPALAESATRAVVRCQPYTMLKPEHYEQWKDMEIGFTPSDFGPG
jgi:colicin import membrane protein